MASPLRLQIACRRDAIVMPKRLSVGFPIVGRTSALRLLSQSVTHTNWMALVASISHCFLDKGSKHVRNCGSQLICGFDTQLHLVCLCCERRAADPLQRVRRTRYQVEPTFRLVHEAARRWDRHASSLTPVRLSRSLAVLISV